jgi:hypothetical protein
MSAPIPATLQRETFELSREMEFFSEKELTAQIGFSKPGWPVALLKELIDNALDACESANIQPAITLELHYDALVVADNGPGLPLAALERSLDYLVRVSDKTGYVSPSRGQQGNALKTLWAAPFVATGTGLIEVQTAAYRREVRITLDRIAQVPRLELSDPGEPPDVKKRHETHAALERDSRLSEPLLLPDFLQHGAGVCRLQSPLHLEYQRPAFRWPAPRPRHRSPLATLATRPPDRAALVST